jgi:hypothetical protein
MWEEWIDKAYQYLGFNLSIVIIRLWLTFLFIDPKFSEAIEVISEKLLQSLYVLQPQLEGVLFSEKRRSRCDLRINIRRLSLE